MQTVSTALHVETKGTHGNSENIIRGRKRIQRNSQQRGVFDLGLFRELKDLHDGKNIYTCGPALFHVIFR